MKRRSFISKTVKTSGLLATGMFPAFNIISKPQKTDRLGVALVGLGSYSTGQLAPALQQTTACYLAGIVTGTPSKADDWADTYDIPERNIYDYDSFDEIASNKDIDIIYIVLPNSMHAEYTIRAARAGKHVICEKPMATSYEDSRRMVQACKEAGKKLSIGYRLHFEPHNLEMMRLGQKKIHGPVQQTRAGFAFELRDKSRWRLDKQMSGGGPLMDVGIYAVQGTIYTLGQLPTVLKATDTTRDKSFYGDVEGSLECRFTFPSKVDAQIRTSYEEQYGYLEAQAESCAFSLSPAYSYGGLKGIICNEPMDLPHVNQQALQMDDFARCILEDRESIVSGIMGMRDMFILNKIYESMHSGKEVSLAGIPQLLHIV